MGKHINRFILNLGLLIIGLTSVLSGLLLQIEYHIGNHGNNAINEQVFGVYYNGWPVIHKISIVILLSCIMVHIYHHWKWFKIVIKKRLLRKNVQVLMLSIIFILVAITGLIPWLIHLMKGNILPRKVFIEIHDKLAIILTVYLILHVFKRLKWFFYYL
jgi:hypothetical protein